MCIFNPFSDLKSLLHWLQLCSQIEWEDWERGTTDITKQLKGRRKPIKGCIYFLCVETGGKLCLWSITVSGHQVGEEEGREGGTEEEEEGRWEGGEGGGGGEEGGDGEGGGEVMLENYRTVGRRWEAGERKGHWKSSSNDEETKPSIASQGNGEAQCTWKHLVWLWSFWCTRCERVMTMLTKVWSWSGITFAQIWNLWDPDVDTCPPRVSGRCC